SQGGGIQTKDCRSNENSFRVAHCSSQKQSCSFSSAARCDPQHNLALSMCPDFCRSAVQGPQSGTCGLHLSTRPRRACGLIDQYFGRIAQDNLAAVGDGSASRARRWRGYVQRSDGTSGSSPLLGPLLKFRCAIAAANCVPALNEKPAADLAALQRV